MLLRGMKTTAAMQTNKTLMYPIMMRVESVKTTFRSVNVRNLVDALRSRGNPFLEAGVDLVNLDGRISNAKDVSAIYDKCKDQYDQFVNDVIVTRNAPLDSTIRITRFSS